MDKNQTLKICSCFLVISSLLSTPAVWADPLTPSQIQQVNSGLYRSNSQDFFEQGRRNLEAEIEKLLRRILMSERPILEIDEELRSELCHHPIELSSRDSSIISDGQIGYLKQRVTEICQSN